MTDDIERQRRALLKASMALCAGLAAGALRAQPGHAQAASQEVQWAALYQDHPYGDQACAGCHYFVPGKGTTGACQLVQGAISPAGWCNLYAPNNL